MALVSVGLEHPLDFQSSGVRRRREYVTTITCSDLNEVVHRERTGQKRLLFLSYVITGLPGVA